MRIPRDIVLRIFLILQKYMIHNITCEQPGRGISVQYLLQARQRR